MVRCVLKILHLAPGHKTDILHNTTVYGIEIFSGFNGISSGEGMFAEQYRIRATELRTTQRSSLEENSHVSPDGDEAASQ